MTYSGIKRIVDFVMALTLLVVISSFLVLTSFFLLIIYRSNPFFCQKRIGENEKEFTLIKFKTMYNDEILGVVGVFLRRSKLDELPQLINVFLGQMSFVGPRPLLPEYLTLYTEEQKKRHTVKPGITGLVQISGGNALSWQDRFMLDLKYVNTQNFGLDCKILVKTFLLIFSPNNSPLFSEKFNPNDDIS